MEILKKILLNKVFCLGEKNTNESLDKAIETANLYLDLYKNDLDDQFMKMTGRLVKFKMKKKEWDEAKKNIDIILNYYKDNNNIPDWVKILENEFNNGNVIAKEKKSSNIYMKFKNAMESDDKKIIENMDKGNKKYQEYQKIQEEKFMHLKKNIDIKLSDEYAYMIRNELQETFGVNGTVLAYQLYSKDMTKLKEKISKNLENEKK